MSDKIHEVLADMAQRQLSEKEGQRVRAAVSVSEDIVRTNLAEGKNPRSDWFGNTWGDPLPDDATEIIEGVLMAAQHEHETRKVAILGRILGNLAFTPQIDRDYANILIRSASELTYRQFCILALLARGDSEELDLPVKLEVGDGSGPLGGAIRAGSVRAGRLRPDGVPVDRRVGRHPAGGVDGDQPSQSCCARAGVETGRERRP